MQQTVCSSTGVQPVTCSPAAGASLSAPQPRHLLDTVLLKQPYVLVRSPFLSSAVWAGLDLGRVGLGGGGQEQMLTFEDNGFFRPPSFRPPSFWRSVTVCFL